MKLAPTLALVLLTACTGPRSAGPAPMAGGAATAPRVLAADPRLAAISLAMTRIDDAELRGDIAGERARWSAAVEQAPESAKDAFLAAYALPHGDDTWAELRDLTRILKGSALGYVGMARLYVEWRVLDVASRHPVESVHLQTPAQCWRQVQIA